MENLWLKLYIYKYIYIDFNYIEKRKCVDVKRRCWKEIYRFVFFRGDIFRVLGVVFLSGTLAFVCSELFGFLVRSIDVSCFGKSFFVIGYWVVSSNFLCYF